jgi:hypothetical protein
MGSKVSDPIVYFPELRISLDADGLRIQAVSPLFHRFFQGPPGGRKQKLGPLASPWTGLELITTSSRVLPSFCEPGAGLFLPHDSDQPAQANLLWLCSPKLDTGVDITLPCTLGLNDIKQYYLDACGTIQEFYRARVKSQEFTASFQEVLGSVEDQAGRV